MFKLSQQKNQNSDYILIITAVLLLILSSAAVFWVPQALQPKIIGQANLTIDFGNGNKRAFEGNIVENETLIDVLNQAARAGEFSYKLNGKNNLDSISQLANNNQKSWQWYLNGEKINKQPGEITVKSDNNVLIKYE
ncbi:hypothetical protein A2819_00970 [Candidatus Azambacteria bacterium RIFCSPHIGHO2_01_FULL_40_24]|uniref:DUF4430 domain-containing protein n=1 Tax=Candidatus Azambacteria bacterium RIFCSPHIGHO2_01_FULL_40_24 TaxID=1797301 RepID=A0A1F5B2H5_9BACT|nr:MAG: hypothetical protein A2819_00970 [Candidatus Azambacteria bacterium RIFCSPHIGHO2_01_FULL_40_24]